MTIKYKNLKDIQSNFIKQTNNSLTQVKNQMTHATTTKIKKTKDQMSCYRQTIKLLTKTIK